MGVLFFQEGEPSEMYTVSDSGPSIFGRKSIPTFVESVVREGAILDIYRSRREEAGTPACATPPCRERGGIERGDPNLRGSSFKGREAGR